MQSLHKEMKRIDDEKKERRRTRLPGPSAGFQLRPHLRSHEHRIFSSKSDDLPMPFGNDIYLIEAVVGWQFLVQWQQDCHLCLANLFHFSPVLLPDLNWRKNIFVLDRHFDLFLFRKRVLFPSLLL
eukprot:TRINITY_DN7373_c0_g1_i1.p1 TRINITY_DN7373_c0_g1~~TRINITY_DN7373_c0_g1_i1.p1  ORF type:complete len:126 (-),score=25.86 TRINITY_DN7373_c0_g1_i1:25-402(-)